MSFPPGTRLGAYEILSPLGAGGMGEVYRARDTRLDRPVAIKVLPQHLATDPAARERFEREARLVSGLNHPHICTLYDVGHQDDADFLVMEYLEGETLGARLVKGPLPLEQAVRFAVQIADALDKAHRQGVVHRDLKPGNIMLTRTGAKLLDFGLAKLRVLDVAGAIPGSSALPTQRADLTAEGSILGTLQYMAPEQLEGKEADARSDIFSLGSLLYEMVTGRKAFEGKSQASIIAAILTSEPQPVSSIQSMSPPALDRIVRICMAKDPDERWQSAHDIAAELRWLSEAGSQAGVTVPAATRRTTGTQVLFTYLVLVASGLVLGVVATRLSAPTSSPAGFRFVIHPPGTNFANSRLNRILLSPDGRRIVYWSESQPALLVREMNEFESHFISGTEGGSDPFLSPDGAWVGFFADGKIKKVSVAGGDPIVICDAPTDSSPGAAWGPDGSILFSPSWTTGLWRVDARGGKPAELTSPKGRSAGYIWPDFLPDGSSVLFTLFGGAGLSDAKVALLDLKTSRYDVLLEGAAGRYISTGHIIFYKGGAYYAVPFDLGHRKINGAEFPVLQGVKRLDPLGARGGVFAFSSTGLLAYVPGDAPASTPYTRLAWISRDGRMEPLAFEGNHGRGLSLSPDQRRAAVTRFSSGDEQVWIYDLSRGTQEKLTRDGQNFDPIWHPDGSRLAYTTLIHGSFDIRVSPADGSLPPESLMATDRDESHWQWLPDGRTATFEQTSPETGPDIWLTDAKDPDSKRLVVATPLEEDISAISPDGRWLAYQSGGDLYISRYPGPPNRVLVARHAVSPHWSPAGPELFFVEGGKLMALRYDPRAETFQPQTPVALFDVRGNSRSTDYAVADDGMRFLFFVPVPGHEEHDEIRIEIDGFAELKSPPIAGRD